MRGFSAHDRHTRRVGKQSELDLWLNLITIYLDKQLVIIIVRSTVSVRKNGRVFRDSNQGP